jgi:hypothetical protein
MSTADAEAEMEARIARLESDVAHIRTDMSDVKIDIRRVDSKIDNINTALIGRSDDLKDSLIAIKDEIASAKVWALVLNMALAGGMFGTMARGFGWL